MTEEHALDWRNWAREVIGLQVGWPDFYLTNGIVVVLGISAAMMAPEAPTLALGFPALMLINTIFFHILPVIRFHDRFSLGLFTAVVLFLPVVWGCYAAAATARVLTTGVVIVSRVIGALLMATPIVLLTLKSHPYFRQDRS